MQFNGKTVLITGATSGIGLAAAEALARQGWEVVLHGRNAAKAEQARASLIQKTGNARIHTALADLSLMADVRRLAAEVQAHFPRLDALINNAGGVMNTRREETAEGNERTMALNVLAPWLLTALLLGSLRAAPEGRIVHLSSGAHNMGRNDLDDFNLRERYDALRAYGDAKLYVILMTQELDRRLRQAGITHVTVNAMHPGVVATNFSLDTNSLFRYGFKLLRPLLLTPAQGADTAVWLASSPEAAGQSGGYYQKRHRKRPRATHTTPANAARLWGICEQLTGERVL